MKTPGSKRAKAVESAEDARIRKVFEQFDTNRGGSLDRKELRNALEALGMEGTRENVRAATDDEVQELADTLCVRMATMPDAAINGRERFDWSTSRAARASRPCPQPQPTHQP